MEYLYKKKPQQLLLLPSLTLLIPSSYYYILSVVAAIVQIVQFQQIEWNDLIEWIDCEWDIIVCRNLHFFIYHSDKEGISSLTAYPNWTDQGSSFPDKLKEMGKYQAHALTLPRLI